ncbi:hypothetical protein QL285_088027 [Trifolium repens]|nr:hypothetical protein QL285_088027 [Trifolium repens]
MGERCVPDTPSDEGDDEDAQKIKIAEDALKSLVDSISGVKVVSDASTSLAQDQPQADVLGDSNVQQDEVAAADVTGNPSIQLDEIVADSPVQQKEAVTGDMNTDNAMSENLDYVTADEDEGANEDDNTEDDVTIMKIVGDSRKKGGKTGVGSRLRVRKERLTEVVAEEPKSTKK